MRQVCGCFCAIIIMSLGYTEISWAGVHPSAGSPARNSAFGLLESGTDFVRLQYRNPSDKRAVGVEKPIYAGIPVGASYELQFLSWGYRPFTPNDSLAPALRSDSLSSEEFGQFQKNLKSAVDVRRCEFQELDGLKVQINSSSKIAGPEMKDVVLNDLIFEIRWQEGSAPKPDAVSGLDAGFSRLFRDLCINGDQASSLRRKRILPEAEKTKGFHPAVVGYKEEGPIVNLNAGVFGFRSNAARASIRKTGMVAVRSSDLIAQGVPPEQVKLDQVRVWNRGVEIPVAIDENGDNVFGPGDAIVFFGRESDSEYTQDSPYFITWSEMATPPRRIETHPLEWNGAGSNSFLSNARYADDKILVEEKNELKYDWYFLEMSKRSEEIPIELTNIVPEGDVQITLNAFNKSRANKGFTVQIGDATAHFTLSTQVNSATTYVCSVSASSIVKATTFGVTLDEEPEPYYPLKEGMSEKVGNVPHLFFDSVEILYPRSAALVKGASLLVERSHQKPDCASILLQATAESEALSAWIIDATGDVVRWKSESTPPDKGIAPPSGDWMRMEIMQDSSLPGPWTIDRDYASSLHRRDQGFDYVIVAPRFLAIKSLELARRRTEEGFQVLVVDVQDIYDEFNEGYPDCAAIRNFFRYAQSEWRGLSPEFIVFIGDSSWDHRDRQQHGAVDYLPTYAPVENPMADATDEWYAYLWGGSNDYFSDLILGRISVQNIEDFQKYLTKMDVYAESKVGPWRARSVYITDDDDGTFERFAISNSEQSLPEHFYPYFIHQGHYPLVTNPYLFHQFTVRKEPGSEKYLNKKYCPECAKAIIDEFNHGQSIVQYIGHGGNQLWSDERIFYGTNKPTSNLLELKPNTRFPFVMSWSCLTGYFNFNIEPFTICLSEELLRYPDRGAIAVWGPSGGGTTNKHMSLSKLILRNLSQDGLDRLGEAATLAKVEFMQEENSPSLANQYILFGDPGVHLAMPQEDVPVNVNPGFFVANEKQDFELSADLQDIKTGQAIVSMTLAGNHVYQSEPFDFTGGQIRHQFSAAIGAITDATAVARFYAWNEGENKDAWGGCAISRKTATMELGGGAVEWNGEEATIRFELINSSPFPYKNIPCALRVGDRIENVTAVEIAASATTDLVWKGVVPSDVVCAYASISADPAQGIAATEDSKALVIPLRVPETNPLVPLTGLVSYSAKELVAGKQVRIQIPVRNFAPDIESFASFAMDGPGSATEVKDVTLAGERERRLDFAVTLPEMGEAEYKISKRFSGGEQTYPIRATVQGKPDLALAEGEFSVQPARPVIGKTVFLKTTVYNVGDGPASDIIVKAFDGDPALKRELRPYNSYRAPTIDSLAPGESKEITIVWDPVSFDGLGNHDVYIEVDPQNRIDELSEDNNQTKVSVTLYDLPDLAVDRWTDHGFRAVLSTGIPIWGQPMQLLGRVKNIGDSDADYARLTFVHNKKDITHFFDKIPQSVVAETYVDVPLYSSKNTLRVIADRYDLIAEKNEKLNAIDFGNNMSEEQRIDFQLTMPEVPPANGRRIYRVTDEITFAAGKGEFLIYDNKHDELILHPDLETVKFRIVPAFVQNQDCFSLNNPTLQWQWNTKYNCFYSPANTDTIMRVNLPAPNGIYDASVHLFSPGYKDGKTAKIAVKTSLDPDFRIIEHGETPDRYYFRRLGEGYHIRDDQFTIEFRPIPGEPTTVIADVLFTRSNQDTPVSGGYLSPYFPASGSGGDSVELNWRADIPEGTALQMRARWVMRGQDGSFRFMPWARTAEGQQGKLELPGKGDFLQYYANFIRFTHDAATPKLRTVLISIPCSENGNAPK